MTKMSNKHTASFKKDPLADRQSVVNSMKGFKGAKSPGQVFKETKPKTGMDAFYHPHKAKVVQ